MEQEEEQQEQQKPLPRQPLRMKTKKQRAL
jgi:hypothetical protein